MKVLNLLMQNQDWTVCFQGSGSVLYNINMPVQYSVIFKVKSISNDLLHMIINTHFEYELDRSSRGGAFIGCLFNSKLRGCPWAKSNLRLESW